jgi:AraC-like DNA-binding protein
MMTVPIIADGFKGEKAIVTPPNIQEYQETNNITKLLYLTHIGYYPKAKYHFRERPKGCYENIMIYCEEGKGWIENKEKRFYLTKNQYFIIPANERHAYGSDIHDPWSIYWLHFKGQNTYMFASIMNRVLSVKDSDTSRNKDRIMLFEEMYRNLEMGYQPDNLEYISFCLMYFLASFKYLTQYQEIKKLKVDDVVEQSICFMKDNLENKITLSDIAKAVNYSNSRLINLFVQRTSYTPITYYNQLKIQRSCNYLQFSNLKVKEIAFRLGYYDPFHFTKAFIKEMGITPKEYRKNYR